MIVGITMVKDEADIVRQTVEHMLAQVDFVYVADNGSTDGTKDILHDLLAEGRQFGLLNDSDPAYYQSRKMTALAAKAKEHGAEWVVPFDADEVWSSPYGRIADRLSNLAPELLVATAPIYNYFATGQDDPELPPVERLRWRLRDPLPLPKVACRAREGLTIHAGNHGASFNGLDEALTVDGMLEVRHFPYRSPEQFVRKVANGAAAYAATDLPRTTGQHWREYGENLAENGPAALEAWFREHFWSDDPENNPSLIFDPVSSSPSVGAVPTASAPSSG